MQRAISYKPAGTFSDPPVDTVLLSHDQRHLRRKLLHLESGSMIMLDLKEPVVFSHGDRLVLENSDHVEIVATAEKLFDITGSDRLHLTELAWHLSNRHLPAAIGDDRIRIQRGPVIRTMLEGLGATVQEVEPPFHPLRGAYHSHGHSHGGHGHHTLG